MNFVLWCCLLCCTQPLQQKDLVRRLEADFQELVKLERHPLPLHDAAQLLEENRKWWPDANALGLLRRSRAKASVPLLLKYLATHPAEDPRNAGEYLDLLMILTGEDLPAQIKKDKMNPQESWPRTVEFLIRDWWLANQEKITTDIGKMTPEQVERVVDRLLKKVETNDRSHGDGYGDEGKITAWGVSHKLGNRSETAYRGRPYSNEELHPAMVPAFLSLMGYEPKAKNLMPRETYRILYNAVPMLAYLYNNGEAADLDKVAEDTNQNSAVRLTCILAVHHAGEDLRTRTVLSILGKEKNFERRLVCILVLAKGRETKEVVSKLVEFLDDKNQHIREAAVMALKGRAPRESVPKLQKLLIDQEGLSDAVMNTIAVMETKEAKQALADYLELVLKRPALYRVYHVLRAFQTVTGQSWIEAGAHDDAYYRAKARKALDWWKTQQ